jgi:hypothetical protein
MSNVASVLKDEIARVARKEIRRETTTLKKSSTTHRSEIAVLKRRVLELERQLRQLGRAGQSNKPIAANEDSVSPGTRFSAKSMAAQRRRLGLSAAECGLLIGRLRSQSTTGKRGRHARELSICPPSSR